MDFKRWLSEMPIVNFQRIGDWEPEKNPSSAYQQRRAPRKGYYSDDYGILTSEAGVEKIKRKWSKCEQPFATWFLRSKEGAKVREEGLVGREYLTNVLKLPPETVEQIDNPGTINILYTNNMGAERMPMNWWTMAHRVGHAMNRGGYNAPHVPQYDYFVKETTRELYTLLDSIYNYKRQPEGYGYGGYGRERSGPSNQKMLLALATAIGSMKSARENNIRNLGEFFHELTAQYIIEGKVHFRPLPNMLPLSYTWGRPQGKWRSHELDNDDMEGWNDYLSDHLAPLVNANIGRALDSCIGKVFVM